MQFGILALMVGVLAYNIYGVLQVGVERATTMQWAATGIMALFVTLRIGRMLTRGPRD